ncbi:MAG: OmpA family protein [Elusimicrobium sp.]|jgi:outer membrane protein OmpA-like peptidoglycan-associated protein|nr:OmpA family protein [Elusimicrobium sp.]
MKHLKIFLLAFILVFAACSGGNQNTKNTQDPVIKREQRKNAKWAKQSSADMLRSGNIPTVEFEFDSIRLASSAYPILDKVAAFMVPNPDIKLIVEGHTDYLGSDEYNDWLSASRAMAIKSYIVSRGVYPDSIKAYGYGKRRPLTLDGSPEGRQTNRRVQFTITNRNWEAVY